MSEFMSVILGSLLLYIGWLHLQLHISRKVIANLRATNVTLVEKPAAQEWRPMVAAAAGLIVMIMVMLMAGR
jgi:hypothetical protein